MAYQAPPLTVCVAPGADVGVAGGVEFTEFGRGIHDRARAVHWKSAARMLEHSLIGHDLVQVDPQKVEVMYVVFRAVFRPTRARVQVTGCDCIFCLLLR
ncbi:hypothetical protein ACIBEK_06495 [Nocardia fusca]|uniref:hypothetical protein n=1 Tax=Nocardia fusca TaxID=941183 RepID=UPI0037A35C0B